VNTEITETTRGWVVYDGNCTICRTWAGYSYRILRRRGFRLAAFQVPWVRQQLDLKNEQFPGEMLLLIPQGKRFGGADAIMQISRAIWWALAIYALSKFPGMMTLFGKLYRRLAENRNCIGKSCQLAGKCNRSPDHSITSSFYELP
jgi:predicted DCC family thiol-disulfide oxidoreductase YuxK